MVLQDTTLIIMTQHDLIQRYEDMIASQQRYIRDLWAQIYKLLKLSLSIDTTAFEKAELLTSLSYAALCTEQPEEAMRAANEGLGVVSDESIEVITRLMQNLERAQNDLEA